MKYKTKLAIIGTVGVPAKYGGFETLAHQLVTHLSKKLAITVYNSSKHYKGVRIKQYQGASIKYLPLNANGVQSILYDILSMLHAILFCDVLLILGVSGCLFLPVLKLFSNKKIIVNVDGLEWRRAKWSGLIKKFLIASEKIAIYFADEVITDNAAIKKYVWDRYGKNSLLIEYGADHNTPVSMNESDRQQFSFLNAPYAFKVCRIEPENNIHLILEAFQSSNELPLVIIGNWDKSEYGRSLKARYDLYPSLHLLDPIYEARILNLIRSNAKLYVHGHSAGGTNPSLVEAMYLGLPILAFDVIYNKITTEGKAFYFNTVKDIQDILQVLDELPLSTVSSQLQEVAQTRYRWEVIAYKYYQIAIGTKTHSVPTFDFELPLSLRQAF